MEGRATQRRRIGVLTLLAAAPTGQVSRDRLIALLWPEADTESARHLLAGAVYELRKALGEEAILSRGDELALNPLVVDCDVTSFTAALTEGALQSVIQLYRGGFAEGLHVSQAPEFDRWLEQTRAQYLAGWQRALAVRARELYQASDLAGAADNWTRLAESDRSDISAALRAAEALELSGEIPRAIRLCRLHCSYVEQEIGTQPDSRVTRLLERLSSAPPSRAEPVSTPLDLAPAAAPVTRRRNRLGQIALWAAAGSGALLLVALTRDDGAHAAILPADRLTEVAAEGTRSRLALQEWLAGERDYRNGHFLRASSHFARATEKDSSFALAFYRLSQSSLAGDLPESDASAADERMMRLAPTLPERERLLLAAYAGFRAGNAEYAEQRYQGLTTRFPEDLEAWLQLGETRFHYGPLRGVPLSLSVPPFRRALALDPGNWNANWHLANLAALSGDRAAALQALDRLLAMSPEGAQRIELELLKAISRQERSRTGELLTQLGEADELLLFQIVWRTAVFFHDADAAQQAAQILTHHGRPTYSQMLGRVSLAHLMLAKGDPAGARQELIRGSTLPGTEGTVLTVRAMTLLVPGAEPSRTELAELRTTLSQAPSPSPESSLSLLLTGLLSSALGESDSALKLASRVEELGSRDWAQSLRADVAFRQARYELVLDLLRDQRNGGWYGMVVSSLAGLDGRIRFLRAEALFQTGHLEEAAGWYGSLGEHSLADLGYWPAAQERRNQILARLSN